MQLTQICSSPSLLLSPLAIPLPLCNFVLQHPRSSGPGAHTHSSASALQSSLQMQRKLSQASSGRTWKLRLCAARLWLCCFQNQFKSLSGFATFAKCRAQPDKPAPGRTSGVVSGPHCWSCKGWELRCKDT